MVLHCFMSYKQKRFLFNSFLEPDIILAFEQVCKCLCVVVCITCCIFWSLFILKSQGVLWWLDKSTFMTDYIMKRLWPHERIVCKVHILPVLIYVKKCWWFSAKTNGIRWEVIGCVYYQNNASTNLLLLTKWGCWFPTNSL